MTKWPRLLSIFRRAWSAWKHAAVPIIGRASWKAFGHTVKLMAPQFVKPYVKTNQPRQKVQAIVKDACTNAGIELELKIVTAAVFFGSDAANPDTHQKFWADMQMYVTTMGAGGDPQVFMEQFTTEQISQKANKWSSRNLPRWSNAEYDATFKARLCRAETRRCGCWASGAGMPQAP